jgi:hypothetical protein
LKALPDFADVDGVAPTDGLTLRSARSACIGVDITGDDFALLLDELTRSAESGDGARFANLFTEDAIYHDYIYGAHRGRADIALKMQDLFHRDTADYRAATQRLRIPGRKASYPPVFALRASPGTLRLRLSWLRHA